MSDNTGDQDQPGLWDPPRARLSENSSPRRRASQSIRRRPGGQEGVQLETKAASSTVTAAHENLWDADRVAAYLGVPKQTLYAWRHSGKGPKGFRVGKHLRWRAQTVVEWTLELERDQ